MICVNNGQRLLVETGATLAAIAADTKSTSPAVALWKKGKQKPNEASRTALYKFYGIAPDAWDAELPPGFEITPPEPNARGAKKGTGRKPNAPKPKPDKKPKTVPYPKAPPEDASTIDQVRYSLKCIRHDLKHLSSSSATARSKLRSDEIRTNTMLIKLEREIELSEDRYVKNHPAFKLHCERILAAVKPYPKAAQAIIEALAK